MGLAEDKKLLQQIESGDYEGTDPRKPFIVASTPSILAALNEIHLKCYTGYVQERSSNRTEDGKVTLTEKDMPTALKSVMAINQVVNELRERVKDSKEEAEVTLHINVKPWLGLVDTALPVEPVDV